MNSFGTTSQLQIGLGMCFLLSTLSVQGETQIVESRNTVTGFVQLVDTDGKSLESSADVVIFIDGYMQETDGDAESGMPKISHKGKQFSPTVLPIVKGSEVDFYNDDGVFHNVFSLSPTKPFDLGIYAEGSSKYVKFEKTGRVALYCNIHPNMMSTILVLNNPFYAVSDDNGKFSISGIPDGEYTLRTWHKRSETANLPISLSQMQTMEIDIDLAVSKRIGQHKNKFGKNYRAKY